MNMMPVATDSDCASVMILRQYFQKKKSDATRCSQIIQEKENTKSGSLFFLECKKKNIIGSALRANI